MNRFNRWRETAPKDQVNAAIHHLGSSLQRARPIDRRINNRALYKRTGLAFRSDAFELVMRRLT